MAVDHSGYAGTTSTTDKAFIAVTAVVFLTCAVATVYLCRSMQGSMPMPGGWSMSMAWMRMPGQTWLGAAVSFIWMWALMMIAMMLPAIAPMLWTQRRFALAVAAGYFFVWILVGALVYPIGVVVALAAMRSEAFARAVPILTGIAVLLAGCVQLTSWKMRELADCRHGGEVSNSRRAWSLGVRSGLSCVLCCSGYMAAFIVLGVMSIGGMVLTALTIAFERISPQFRRIARTAGALMIASGTWLIVRAIH